MKIVVINNHSVLNAGDYAILLQTLRILHGALPQALVVLTFNDSETAKALLPTYRIHAAPPAWGATLDQHRRVLKVSRLRRGLSLLALLFGALLMRWLGSPVRVFRDQQKQALLVELATADLVIACGGGYLYHWFTFASALSLACILMRRRLVMLPQSIGPFHHPLQVRLAQMIVQGADLVLTRESISLQRALDLGAREARCEPDLAFAFPAAPTALARAWLHWHVSTEPTPTMYVGLTAIDWQGQNSRFHHQQHYEQVLVDFINRLTDQGAIVVLFAQTCGPSCVEDDRLVNLRLYRQVHDQQRVFMINEPLHPAMLQALYGCMDYFVATRLHSFILATNAGVPALNIGYLSKSAGILGDMGLSERCLDIEHLTLAGLWEAFVRLQYEGLPISAKAYVSTARQRQQMLQTELAERYGRDSRG
ncbi:polysaccharide pyruvyl transferase family protein [uncultured Chloroflexus sp.]|uniref:polysaccharide pyruvyl transferase family protein n=1 Tax=uncultured Chloroflexus sp. TaxID=214040 RepID=UPI002607BA87|nr:polysaccharide pyruvyl transferase family protein [uncultured Chloroflexus sp.]